MGQPSNSTLVKGETFEQKKDVESPPPQNLLAKVEKFAVENPVAMILLALSIAGGIVLTPLVIVGLVQAIGFGSGGIVAGSFAAWLMSLGGGATAAGSLVAILQSIGAAGLSLGATIASSITGATIGGLSWIFAVKHN